MDRNEEIRIVSEWMGPNGSSEQAERLLDMYDIEDLRDMDFDAFLAAWEASECAVQE